MTRRNAVPLTGEELWKEAAKEARRLNIPERWHDDAVQEFVVAGMEAGLKGGDNPRLYQLVRGRGGMIDFWRREIHAENDGPPGSGKAANRISLDMVIPGMDGETTTLAETIPDGSVVIPGDEPPRQINEDEIHLALSSLAPEEREAAVRVLVNHESQKEAAHGMGKTRRQIQWLLNRAQQQMREAFPDGLP